MKEKLGNKSFIIIGIFIIAIIIILFGGAFIYNKVFYKKSYSEVENIMLKAAKNYFEKNDERLPININDSITLSDTSLVKAGEMNDLDDYLKSNSSCSGEVRVTNINGDYRYTSILDCGDDYLTKTLNEYVDDNVEIVTSGNGLYELNNELVYRGDNVNNYIKVSGKLYRIVKFVDDRAVVIYTEKLESTEWDNRYNIDREDNSGINDYKVSRMREYLNNLYEGNTLLSPTAKLMVTNYDLPIGKRCNDDMDRTGNLEKNEILEDQYIGLLPVSDFLNASIDVNCTSTVSPSCSNYNYLSRYKYDWWTITANSKNTYKAYRISNIASTAITSTNAYVRPVLYLASDIIYVSGDGSSENPYIVK